jgi:hypothetical protein
MEWTILIAVYAAAVLFAARGWLQATRLIRHWAGSGLD